MKRQCTDPNAYPNTTADMSSDNSNHQFLLHNQTYSSPLQNPPLPFPENYNMASPFTDPTRFQPDPKPMNSSDGASVENQRRPRGRPPGSKNKPKPNNPTRMVQPDPTRPNNAHNTNHHIILEIPNGADVIDAISNYTLRHNVSLRVHQATGAVTNVRIRQSNNQHHTSMLPGQHNILSLTALFSTPSIIQSQMVQVLGAFNDVTVTFAVGKGNQVIGGVVVGPLLASGSVFVFAESVQSLEYCRMGMEEEERAENRANGDENGNNADYGVNVGVYRPASFMPY